MNHKFFDVSKEKQDRIINAALLVFAQNGYRHAGTDEVVRRACISKGLLFHYFESKLGLYVFLYDYAVRFMLLELSGAVDKTESDLFVLIRLIRRGFPAGLQAVSLHEGVSGQRAGGGLPGSAAGRRAAKGAV